MAAVFDRPKVFWGGEVGAGYSFSQCYFFL